MHDENDILSYFDKWLNNTPHSSYIFVSNTSLFSVARVTDGKVMESLVTLFYEDGFHVVEGVSWVSGARNEDKYRFRHALFFAF